jgi:hypothetical protein
VARAATTTDAFNAIAEPRRRQILDILAGRPFHTPTILGIAIFLGGQGLGSRETVPVSFEMVLLYTWVHALVFCVIGGIAARLLAVAERQPNAGFGILLVFVVFEFGFVVLTLFFAEPVFRNLGRDQGSQGIYTWEMTLTFTNTQALSVAPATAPSGAAGEKPAALTPAPGT